MLRDLWISCVALLALTLLTGGVYPGFITALAGLLCPERARGSLIVVDDVVRGSRLVGQAWRGDVWFHGRPSATVPLPCQPMPSGGSNLGPTNPELARLFTERAEALRALGLATPLPVDLLTASASGIDPHISPAAARAQIERVARARGLDPALVRARVEELLEPRMLGLFGEPRVNVLVLNLALEGRQ